MEGGWGVGRALCAEENPEIRGRRECSPSQELERALILVWAHPTPALGGEPARDREKLSQISECVRGADWGLGLKSGSLDHLAGGGGRGGGQRFLFW